MVKRLVSIEDLGNIVVLFTDKTGTLTEGTITSPPRWMPPGRAVGRGPARRAAVQRRDVLRRTVVGGNQLDQALWQAPARPRAGADGARRLAARPFDYQRRLASVLVEDADGERAVIVKGAPETVLARCSDVTPRRRPCRRSVRRRQPGDRRRHSRRATPREPDRRRRARPRPSPASSFVDRPKADAHEALDRLERLDVRSRSSPATTTVSPQKVCADIGLDLGGTLTGAELDPLDDASLPPRCRRRRPSRA